MELADHYGTAVVQTLLTSTRFTPKATNPLNLQDLECVEGDIRIGVNTSKRNPVILRRKAVFIRILNNLMYYR